MQRDVLNRSIPSQAYRSSYTSPAAADVASRAPNAKAPPQAASPDNPILRSAYQPTSSQFSNGASQGTSLDSSRLSSATSDNAGHSAKTAEFLTISSSHSIPSSVGRNADVASAPSPQAREPHSNSQINSFTEHLVSAAARPGGEKASLTSSSSTVDQSGHVPLVEDTTDDSRSAGDTPDISSVYRRPSSSRERRVPSSPVRSNCILALGSRACLLQYTVSHKSCVLFLRGCIPFLLEGQSFKHSHRLCG